MRFVMKTASPLFHPQHPFNSPLSDSAYRHDHPSIFASKSQKAPLLSVFCDFSVFKG